MSADRSIGMALKHNVFKGTSLEAEKGNAEPACSEKKYKGGGTTCCIPTCNSNTKKNPELSFYQIPTDKKLRKMWLHWIGRVNFTLFRKMWLHWIGRVNFTLSFTFVQSILWVVGRHVFTMFQL